MEDLLNKETVKRVIKILKDFDPTLKVQALSSSARTALDAANSLKCSLDIELSKLPSKFETFNIFADIPHNNFINSYATNVLGWQPTDQLQKYWQKEI